MLFRSVLWSGSLRARVSAALTPAVLTGRTLAPRRNMRRSADGHGGSAAGGDVLPHLGGDALGLVQQGLDDLVLLDGLDDLSLDEDLALAVAGGDAEVGLTGLTGPVDHAAHDRHPQGHLEVLERSEEHTSELQ